MGWKRDLAFDKRARIAWLLLLAILGVAFLPACGLLRKATPAITTEPVESAAPTATEMEAPPTEAAYPGSGGQSYPQPDAYPGAGEQAYPQSTAYPGTGSQAYPQSSAYPNSAYPAGSTSYPAAGNQAYPSPGGPTATSQDNYPAPGTGNATATAAPGAASPTHTMPPPTATATTQPQPSPTPTITLTPTITPTATPSGPTATPRPELQATNPRDVKLDSGRVQLIEFFAYWCGSCRAMAPIIHRLEARYYERMNFVYLDIEDPATSVFKQALFFRLQPEYYLLDEHGKVLKRWSGYVASEELESAIQAALQSP